jgi:hypothetical protein
MKIIQINSGLLSLSPSFFGNAIGMQKNHKRQMAVGAALKNILINACDHGRLLLQP